MGSALVFLKEDWDKSKKILVFSICFVSFILILNLLKVKDGWLGFWGSLLGALIAISGIYWQFHKQKNLEEKQKKVSAINFLIVEFQHIYSKWENLETLAENSIYFYELPFFDSNLFKTHIFRNYSREITKETILNILDEQCIDEILKFINFLYYFDETISRNFELKEARRKIIIRAEDLIDDLEGGLYKKEVSADEILRYTTKNIKEFKFKLFLLTGHSCAGNPELSLVMKELYQFISDVNKSEELLKEIKNNKEILIEILKSLKKRLLELN